MITNEIEDFEDFFYTKETYESDIRDLYRSFDSLYQANKKNKYISGEYKSFKAWADKALKSGAPLFGGGSQIESWKNRYKTAYGYADKKAGPDPSSYDRPFQISDLANNPWAWLGGAIFMSIIIGKLSK